MKIENSMRVLARRGELQARMKITLVDSVLQGSAATAEQCEATVINPNGGKDSLEWGNQVYSPASLLDEFERLFSVDSVNTVCRNWRIVGQSISIRDQAR
jgi:hypothetical protein